MDAELVIEMRGLRCYQGANASESKTGMEENSAFNLGGGLPRRRAYYWLLTYRGRHRRSTSFHLPPEGLWPTPLGVETFRAEWGPLQESGKSNKTTTTPSSAASSDFLQVDLFETGPVGPGPAQSRGRGAEEEEDEEDLESYSIYDFNVCRVASTRVELKHPGHVDRWYPCKSPSTGEVVWGLFIRVAFWLPTGPLPQQERMMAQQEDKEDNNNNSSSSIFSWKNNNRGHSFPWRSVKEDVDDEKKKAGTKPLSRKKDGFGFPIAEHAASEFDQLKSLEELRAMEQRLKWDRIRWLRPSAQRRRKNQPTTATSTTSPISPLQQERARQSRPPPQQEPDGGGGGEDGSILTAALKNLVWDGVPHDLRDEVYQWLSGAYVKKEVVGKDYYQTLAKASAEENLGVGEEDSWVCVSQEKGSSESSPGQHGGGTGGGQGMGAIASFLDNDDFGVLMPEMDEAWGAKVAQDIELDLGRAFADSESSINTPKGRESLRRVLRAYALRNPAVGYCQGMNFIAGLLLIVVQEEETAFWALAHMVEDVSPLCFSPPLLGTRADMRALADLLDAELPSLYRHCMSLNLDLELLAGHWLFVYFINVFPPPVALRILEVAMTEGSDVSFAVALAFLRSLEAEILSCDDLHEISKLIRHRQMEMYDADALLYLARMQIRTMRSRLRISRAWHLGDLIKIEQGQARLERRGSNDILLSSQGGFVSGGGNLMRPRHEDRIRRLMRRSFARGLSLVGLSYWLRPHTFRQLDQMMFQVTHRFLVGDEGRFRSRRFTPVLVDVVSWLMNWPILTRRTGDAALPPLPSSPGRALRPAAADD